MLLETQDRLEDSRSKVNNLDFLHHSSNALHKRQMCGVFFKVILSILFVVKLHDESMGDAALEICPVSLNSGTLES